MSDTQPTGNIEPVSKPVSDAVWHWRWQRLTAIVLIFFSVWFVIALVTKLLDADQQALAKWLGNPLIALAMGAMMLAAYVHKHIGLHEIVTDYVHTGWKKCAVNGLLSAACAVLVLATIGAIWTLHLAGAQ